MPLLREWRARPRLNAWCSSLAIPTVCKLGFQGPLVSARGLFYCEQVCLENGNLVALLQVLILSERPGPLADKGPEDRSDGKGDDPADHDGHDSIARIKVHRLPDGDDAGHQRKDPADDGKDPPYAGDKAKEP